MALSVTQVLQPRHFQWAKNRTARSRDTKLRTAMAPAVRVQCTDGMHSVCGLSSSTTAQAWCTRRQLGLHSNNSKLSTQAQACRAPFQRGAHSAELQCKLRPAQHQTRAAESSAAPLQPSPPHSGHTFVWAPSDQFTEPACTALSEDPQFTCELFDKYPPPGQLTGVHKLQVLALTIPG